MIQTSTVGTKVTTALNVGTNGTNAPTNAATDGTELQSPGGGAGHVVTPSF